MTNLNIPVRCSVKAHGLRILTVGEGSDTLNLGYILRKDHVVVVRPRDWVLLSMKRITAPELRELREATASRLKRTAKRHGTRVATTLPWLRDELKRLNDKN